MGLIFEVKYAPSYQDGEGLLGNQAQETTEVKGVQTSTQSSREEVTRKECVSSTRNKLFCSSAVKEVQKCPEVSV